jgi:DNA-binding FadR family transcriptional regulator
VLTRLTARYAHTARRIPKEEVARGKDEAYAAHLTIADAVIAGDVGKAESATTAHLGEATDWLLAHRSRRPGRNASAAARVPEEPGAKLAEVVAARFRDEIARRGWPVGHVLGSEADMLARHGVRRASCCARRSACSDATRWPSCAGGRWRAGGHRARSKREH